MDTKRLKYAIRPLGQEVETREDGPPSAIMRGLILVTDNSLGHIIKQLLSSYNPVGRAAMER